jgi:hypothetical protein
MLMGALTDVLPEPDSQFHGRRWNVSNGVPILRHLLSHLPVT